MVAAGIVVSVLLGVVIASFLNLCIDRLPRHESLVTPASHCDACRHRLGVLDLIPIFSYLWLRGRCRYCQAPISPRLLWVEISVGAIFGYLYWHYGLSFELGVVAFYSCLFIVVAAIDFEHGLILNRLIYPGMAIAFIISIFLPPSGITYAGGGSVWLAGSSLPQLGILQALIGGSIGFLFFFLIVVISRGGMGWGEVKLAALIGFVTGYLIPVAIFLAIIFGGLAACALLLARRKRIKESIPFGPFLSLATLVTLLWGGSLFDWYLSLF